MRRLLPLIIGACALLAPPPGAEAAPRVTIAWLPGGLEPEALGGVVDLAPGILSAGVDSVDPEQTYLDIGQGNRIVDSLYDRDLPRLDSGGTRVRGWGEVVARADSAPADVLPGLFASSLAAGSPRGAALEAAAGLTAPALLAADREGRIARIPAACRARRCLPPVRVIATIPARLPGLVRGLRGRDLLIAVSRPPPGDDRQLTVGIAGAGYYGNLTSDSTRIDGYVLSTDIAPTVLERFGIDPPSEMSGEPIRSVGSPDVAALASLEDRMGEIGPRRGPVIGLTLLAWVIACAVAVAIWRRRAALAALPLLAIAIVLVPALLLIGAALRPSEAVEWSIVLLGGPALAALLLRAMPAYRAIAAACAATVLAEAVDVVAGSPLTSLSLIGPSPGLGVRFYGIGNELEAALVTVILFGTGAAIAGFAPRLERRRCAAAFVAVALGLGFVFGLGRFGADVGAAIVLPLGGAAAAAAAVGARRRAWLLVLATPLFAVAALAAADLLSGANAHLTRSVLDAGGLHDLGDVAERRLRLSARSFGRTINLAFLPLVAIALALGIRYRQQVLGWFDRAAALRAGFIGAAVATAVGTLVNDSGALLLEVGAAYLLAFAGFAWAEAGNRAGGGR